MAYFFDYDFECLNINDYILKIETSLNNRMFKMVLDKAKEKLRKKRGLVVDGDVDSLERMEVPKNYWNLIKTGLSGAIRSIEGELRDGEHEIKLLNQRVDNMFFVRCVGSSWRAYVVIVGQYIDKKGGNNG